MKTIAITAYDVDDGTMTVLTSAVPDDEDDSTLLILDDNDEKWGSLVWDEDKAGYVLTLDKRGFIYRVIVESNLGNKKSLTFELQE